MTIIRRSGSGGAGADGLTPFVGGNGNWWIGATDTGVAARGPAGAPGAAGAAGAAGATGPIGPAGPAGVPGSTIAGVGDSILERGWSSGAAFTRAPQGGSYLLWAVLLSKGRLRFPSVPIAAHSGDTTAQILSTHVPAILAQSPVPRFVLIDGGTNDQSPMTSAIRANWDASLGLLSAAGVVPVIASLNPRTSANGGAAALNQYLRARAAENGWPYLDVFTLLSDPTTVASWARPSTDTTDGVHQDPPGALIGGTELWRILKPLVPDTEAPLAQNNIVGSLDQIMHMVRTNPLMLDATGGLPTGWNAPTGAGATVDNSRSASRGKYLTLTRASADAAITYDVPTVAGRKLLVCFEVGATVAAGGTWGVSLRKTSDGSVVAGWSAMPLGAPDGCVFTAMVTSPGACRLQVEVAGASGTSASIARPAVLDLSAAGLT